MIDETSYYLDERQRRFEQEVREFLATEVTDEELHDPTALANEHSDVIYRKLAARGWLGMNIPTEYGGQGRGAVDLAIFRDWTSYYRVPLGGFTAASRIGHAIHLLGTPEQKRRYLPGLVSGELLLSIGYTEPGSGSDLASLRTRAQLLGEEFVVNGQKIFTTAGHLADHIFLACRTDPDAPKHRGISVLMVDLTSLGVNIRPLWTLGGWRLNIIFFDEVRVPRENLVGELHGGWSVIRTALDVERTGIQPVALARRLVDDLVALARTVPERLALDRAETLRECARLRAEVTAARLLAYQQAAEQDAGTIDPTASAASKLAGSEVYQRAARFASLAVGGDAFVTEPAYAPTAGRIEREYRYAPQSTIAAGTSEVLRNVIAKTGLGLGAAA